jgi:hypothetical protein
VMGLGIARAGETSGAALGVAGVGWRGTWLEPGRKVSGRVARPAAAGSVGKYSGPCWPQPASAATARPIPAALPTALAARARRLTKIRFMQNILEL